MNILHITNAYPVSKDPAYGIFIKEQIGSIEEQGHQVRTIFINALEKGKLEYLKKIVAIRKTAKWADVIHCHHMYTGFLTLFICRPDKPVVTSFMSPRGSEGRNDKFNILKKELYDYVQQKSTMFIVKENPSIVDNFKNKGYYLPNGTDLSFFKVIDCETSKNKLSLSIKKKYLLFCSAGDKWREEKRYDIFRSVLKVVAEKTKMPVDGLLLINAPRELVPYYFNASSVFLLTSDHEGSPNAVKEALACNVPIVSTNVGNVKYLLDGVSGCYVSKTNDIEELAEYVIKSLKSETIKGRERIKNLKLDMRSVAIELLTVYQKTIELHKI
ncbi:MAG: glycosyltransferase family 4 protein [Thermodesulfobacteriota bacterium]|nr:glycosyltransferase family 4 protein [Thermodesulfobacteriota bacterium]